MADGTGSEDQGSDGKKLSTLMKGIFNGVPLQGVIALKILGMTSGTTRNTLRVLGKPAPELERQFVLRSRASVKVSIHEFQGRITRYDRAVPEGVYEITIQAKE